MQLFEQRFLLDVVETALDVSIEHKFSFVSDGFKDRVNCIMAGASWPEAVTIALKLRFPFRFECHFSQRLFGAVEHGRDTQGPLLSFSWFGYPDPAIRSGFDAFPVLRVYLFCHGKPSLWGNGFDSIDPSRLLALVVLSDPSRGQQPCRFRLHQELLEFLNCPCIATLTGSVDAFLDAEHMLLEFLPGKLAPRLTHLRGWFRCRRCFSLCHRTHPLPLHTAVPTSAYPLAFPAAFASSAIVPSGCIGWHLLTVSTSGESRPVVIPFQPSVLHYRRPVLSTGYSSGWVGA